jgi:hypothetical protein
MRKCRDNQNVHRGSIFALCLLALAERSLRSADQLDNKVRRWLIPVPLREPATRPLIG